MIYYRQYSTAINDIFKWSDAASTNNIGVAASGNLGAMFFTTRDFDFGDVAIRKKIYKLLVTYQSGDINVALTGDFSDATCDTTSESTTVTHDANSSIIAGLGVTGTGIPDNTFIVSITDSTHFVLTNAATLTNSNQTFKFYRNSGITVKASINGVNDFSSTMSTSSKFARTSEECYTSSTLNPTNGAWKTAELKFSTPSEVNNIYSIQFQFSGILNVPESFKINDISIIHRFKNVK